MGKLECVHPGWGWGLLRMAQPGMVLCIVTFLLIVYVWEYWCGKFGVCWSMGGGGGGGGGGYLGYLIQTWLCALLLFFLFVLISPLFSFGLPLHSKPWATTTTLLCILVVPRRREAAPASSCDQHTYWLASGKAYKHANITKPCRLWGGGGGGGFWSAPAEDRLKCVPWGCEILIDDCSYLSVSVVVVVAFFIYYLNMISVYVKC